MPDSHLYGPHFLCWISKVVPFNTWLISSWEEKKMLLQAEQMHKMTYILLKMIKVVILSENNCHFVSCSACNNSNLFSAWDKSRVKWEKFQNSRQKMTTQNNMLLLLFLKFYFPLTWEYFLLLKFLCMSKYSN